MSFALSEITSDDEAYVEEIKKTYLGKEEKERHYFAQGVKDLGAKVEAGKKMTFKGSTFASLQKFRGEKETTLLDGTAILTVNETAKGNLNLDFGNELNLNVKELDLTTGKIAKKGGGLQVEATGAKQEGFNLNGNNNLNLNMYGPEKTKATEAVGLYEFNFNKTGCLDSECEGFRLNGSFGVKKQ